MESRALIVQLFAGLTEPFLPRAQGAFEGEMNQDMLLLCELWQRTKIICSLGYQIVIQ